MSETDADREPKRRFSNRVGYYVKHRPGYPAELWDFIREASGVSSGAVVADVGSGTGLLAQLFLENGGTVYGVEPNADMRAAGEAYLKHFTRFRSIDGCAEETTLPSASVDMVCAGQAFHWFDLDASRREFARILRTGGSVALVWNYPDVEASPFMEAYQAMEVNVPDWRPSPPPRDPEAAPEPDWTVRFFAPAGFKTCKLHNEQQFDWEGLKGRIFSESGAPLPGDARHPAMRADLERAFETHAQNGRVRFLYRTVAYCGRLSGI